MYLFLTQAFFWTFDDTEIVFLLAMFFTDWYNVSRIFISAICCYIALILLLRISGKRTLSKLNAFDLVITVAFGSTLASAITSKDLRIPESILAFAILILLQYVVAWTSVRSRLARKAVKSEPALLFYNGEFIRDSMIRERITEEEILQAIRASGAGELRDTGAVVLETDGTLSILQTRPPGEQLLQNVKRMP